MAYDATRHTSFIVTRDGVVRTLNHATGTLAQFLALPAPIAVLSVALSTDASQLYVGTDAARIMSINIADRSLRIAQSSAIPLHLAVHPDGRRVFASGNGFVSEVDVTSDQRRDMTVEGARWQATTVTSDGRYLFGVSENGIIRRHDLTTYATADVALSCGGWGLGITRDDRFLYVSCPGAGTVLVLDTATRAEVYRLEQLGEVRRITMSLDGRIAAVASSRGVVLIR